VLADAHHVAGVQLAPTAGLALAVDERGRVREQRLDLAAAVDDAGELEQLPEPDRVAADGYLASHRVANVARIRLVTKRRPQLR
jgi:hypothetical protein